MRWTALVLAGSRGAADPVATAAGVAHKAFAPLAGRAMIAHVLDALGEASEVGDIAVSIEPEADPLPGNVLRLDAASGPAASVAAAVDRLGTPLLITTADHPLLTPAMISAFLAGARGVDVAAGVCPRPTVEAAGNPAKRTWLRLADGAVSGTNLFALATPAARGAVTLWQGLEADRKRPWRMARRIGPGMLARYLAGRLDRAAAARAIGAAAGCRAALVEVDHPDAAHDVDRPGDLAFVSARLAARRALPISPPPDTPGVRRRP